MSGDIWFTAEMICPYCDKPFTSHKMLNCVQTWAICDYCKERVAIIPHYYCSKRIVAKGANTTEAGK